MRDPKAIEATLEYEVDGLIETHKVVWIEEADEYGQDVQAPQH